MKKSQMEIMGFAIIVVLLVIGMLFAIQFVLFREPSETRKDYLTTQLAANMLNTLLNTNTNCNEISVTELLQDAAKGSPNIKCPDGRGSQAYVNDVINYTLYQTLDALKRDYYFKASVTSKNVVVIGQEYSTGRERERKTYHLPTDAGSMTIILDLYG